MQQQEANASPTLDRIPSALGFGAVSGVRVRRRRAKIESMRTYRLGSALVCSAFLAVAIGGATAGPHAQTASVETTRSVRAFLDHVNRELLRLSNAESRAGWVHATYITPDTEAIAADASEAFHMISGPSMNDLLTHQDNRLAKLLSTGITSEKVIDELYWSTLTRSPSPAELHRSVKHLDSSADRRAALEDLTWSLLNANEFLLRR